MGFSPRKCFNGLSKYSPIKKARSVEYELGCREPELPQPPIQFVLNCLGTAAIEKPLQQSPGNSCLVLLEATEGLENYLFKD